MLVPIAVALAGTIVVTILYRRSTAKSARWFDGKAVTTGRLTRVREQDDGDFWSTIEYEVGGQRYQITGNFEHVRDDAGASLPVAYDPALPSDAKPVLDVRDSPAGSLLGLAAVFIAFLLVAMAIQSFVR